MGGAGGTATVLPFASGRGVFALLLPNLARSRPPQAEFQKIFEPKPPVHDPSRVFKRKCDAGFHAPDVMNHIATCECARVCYIRDALLVLVQALEDRTFAVCPMIRVVGLVCKIKRHGSSCCCPADEFALQSQVKWT